MQRWHLTAGLVGAALLAAWVAPGLGWRLPTPLPSPMAAADGPLSLRARLDQRQLLRGQDQERFLVLQVEAAAVPGGAHTPVNVAVVLDSSGSMATDDRIGHARQAARDILGALSADDSFSLVTFSDHASTLIPASPVADPRAFASALGQLEPGGGTALYEGLQAGIRALDRPDLSGVKRVVLLSDGMANIGPSDTPTLAALASSRVDAGISVTGIGLGLSFNEDLIAAVSDAGGGRYHFADQPEELGAVFTEELRQMAHLAAQETWLTVSLGPSVEVLEVYGYEAAVRGDGLRVFLGDVHGGESRKVVARLRVRGDGAEIGEARLRYHLPEDGAEAGAVAPVEVQWTDNASFAEASLDPEAAALAASAEAGARYAEGARAWSEGRGDEAHQTLWDTQQRLLQAAARTGSEDLAEEARKIGASAEVFQGAAPAEASGQRALKRAKEAARDYAR